MHLLSLTMIKFKGDFMRRHQHVSIAMAICSSLGSNNKLFVQTFSNEVNFRQVEIFG